jgi:hypothetical protein
MPIDPSIALGVKPIQFESPINQMAKIYELQNLQQTGQANQLAMQEKQRAIAEDEAVRNYFAQQDRSSPDFAKGLYGISPKTGQAYEKFQAETSKEKTLAKNAEIEQLTKIHSVLKTGATQVLANPTLANAIRVTQNVGRMTGSDVSADLAQLTELGDNPEAIRRWAAGHALEADKLLPKTERVDVGGAINYTNIDPLTGLPKVVGTTEKTVAPADAQRIALDKQRIALDKQRLGLEERRVKVAETTGAPGYVKPLNATQQYKLDKLKAADKTNAKLFDASIDAELKNIDKLIGTETAPKLHKGLANATGPITSRLPTGRTDTANAEAYIKSLQSKASINSLQAIRGTAGAIGTMTEREWPRLESMKATLQESQGTDQFIQSLKDYREELKNMKLKSKEALNTDYSTEIGANIPSSNPNIDALLQKYSQE